MHRLSNVSWDFQALLCLLQDMMSILVNKRVLVVKYFK